MKKLIPVLLLSLILSACSLQSQPIHEEQSTEKLTWATAIPVETEQEIKVKTKTPIEDSYTTKTTPHKEAPGEDIFVYNNWEEIFSITSLDRPTYLHKLIENILFVDEWTSAGNRTIIVYNLKDKGIVLETQYYWELEINEESQTLIYPSMNYEKPEYTQTTCWEQEWYFQKYSFNYNTFQLEKTWKVYCSYVE